MYQLRGREFIMRKFKYLGHSTWHPSGCAAEGCPVYATHIVRGPSVALLYLGHQWGGAVDAVPIACLYPEEIVLLLIVKLTQVPGISQTGVSSFGCI